MSFPGFRLVALLGRQLSAPVAARVKREWHPQQYARAHPSFGRAVCMRAGQAHRAAELRFKLWVLRLPQPRAVPPLSDRAALAAGADIIGEVVVFAIGAATIIFEVQRQAQAHEDKVSARRSRWVALRLQLDEVRLEVARQQHDLLRLRAALDAEQRRRARPKDQ